MGWTDKYKCEHDYEKVAGHGEYYGMYYVAELKCTKCGHMIEIREEYLADFLAARSPVKPKGNSEEDKHTQKLVDYQQQKSTEIYLGIQNGGIPSKAISPIGNYHEPRRTGVLDTYAMAIIERALETNGILFVPDGGVHGNHIRTKDLEKLLDFIDKL